MKLLHLTDIAYNNPCIVAIDTSKEARVVTRTFTGGLSIGLAVVVAHYNGELVELALSDHVYSLVCEEAIKSKSDMLYLFVHSKSGVYSEESRFDYFRRSARYSFLSKKEYLQRSSAYGFKVYTERKDEDTFSIAAFKNLSSSLLKSRIGEGDKDRRIFSYSDIENILELCKNQ